MTITTRAGKGSALSHTELDNNFIDLDTRTTSGTSTVNPAALTGTYRYKLFTLNADASGEAVFLLEGISGSSWGYSVIRVSHPSITSFNAMPHGSSDSGASITVQSFGDFAFTDIVDAISLNRYGTSYCIEFSPRYVTAAGTIKCTLISASNSANATWTTAGAWTANAVVDDLMCAMNNNMGYLNHGGDYASFAITGGLVQTEENGVNYFSGGASFRNTVTFDALTLPPISNSGIWSNAKTMGTTMSLSGTYNHMSAGPITINSGVTITVSSGATWTVV